jgi:uncharacterized OB-fold protein
MSRILPRPTALTQPYWDGCRLGELRLQQCAQCRRFQFYPRIICSHCGGSALHWRAASGRGVVASFTVVERAVSKAYSAPYTIALIDLEEGPRMMSWVVNDDRSEIGVGAPVTVTFSEWSEDIAMPLFELTGDAPGDNP